MTSVAHQATAQQQLSFAADLEASMYKRRRMSDSCVTVPLALSTAALYTPASSCRLVHSRVFHHCIAYLTVPRCPLSRFQSPHGKVVENFKEKKCRNPPEARSMQCHSVLVNKHKTTVLSLHWWKDNCDDNDEKQRSKEFMLMSLCHKVNVLFQ